MVRIVYGDCLCNVDVRLKRRLCCLGGALKMTDMKWRTIKIERRENAGHDKNW